MKIAFDIGGVLSKYPEQFRVILHALAQSPFIQVHVITDQHDRDYTLEQLRENGFNIPAERVHNADYARYGEMSKALIMKKFDIDMLIDDFPGYMAWDARLGPAPVRLQVQPDPYRPYWSPQWKTRPGDGEFGRRVCPPFEVLQMEFETERQSDGQAGQEATEEAGS